MARFSGTKPMNIPVDWQVFETAQDVAEAACRQIVSAAKKSILEQGEFKIVLAGGTTPLEIYSLLSKKILDWENWYIYLGDERCYPANHPKRNSVMISKVFTDQISIPPGNIRFIPAQLGSEKAAFVYNQVIEKTLPFDMVILGMGEDGHTASLFPKDDHDDEILVKPVHDAPKNPPERVSLTVSALGNTDTLMIIVTGCSKKEAVKKWRNGIALPVSLVSAIKNRTVLLDKDAL